jgi:exopolysaccharide biosynthesis polyprenyl glycosylphosphotransferase
MSISNQGLGSAEATAANAGVSRPNLALRARVPQTTVPPDAGRGAGAISDREFTLVQVSTDFVCACIALPISLFLLSQVSTVGSNSIRLLGTNAAIDCLFPLAVVGAIALGGMYRVTHHRLQPSAFLEVRDLSFAVGSGCVVALALGALLHATLDTAEPSSTQLVFAVIVTVAIVTVGRIVMRFFLHALTSTRVLVVGSGSLADRVTLSVRQDPGMTFVGRAVDSDAFDPESLGRVSDLPRLCTEFGVHRILVASPHRISGDALATYRQLQNKVHIAMVPQYFELVSWRSRLTDLAGLPFLEIARPHLSMWDHFMKRLFDICISSIVLVLTSPLLVAVAIGVKLSSPGPILFHQVRLGRNRVPFTITKFRTMTVGTEAAAPRPHEEGAAHEGRPLSELRGKLAEQNRVTPFGAFLRRTGIDEIPQFFNVFLGDMSVVGPRPFIPAESGVAGWGTRRFDARPGITGLWQVSGRNDLSHTDLVQLDYLYVASWSLWWDLKIMWETPKTMARGSGAY